MGCSCPGIFRILTDAFLDRVRGWDKYAKDRPEEVAVHVPCPRCGDVWRLQLLRLGRIGPNG